MEHFMISTQHTQSLADFRQKAAETPDRLNRTGEAEVLTVDGEARAVLLSPVAFDELTRQALLTQDVTGMRQALRELKDGKGLDVDAALDPIRAELRAMKAAKQASR
jgi:PHD/YefM family antitoxin component YafN of YafNO toxin-antitoxin module